MNRRIFSPALMYTLVVSLGGFIFGFDASVISGAIGFIVDEYQLSEWQQGFVVSSPTLGGLIATLFAGAISDAFGRRNTLIMIAALYVVSAFASAFATSYGMLVAARFIGGMAFCSLMVAPLYIAEISLPEHRGKLVSINQLNIVLGFSVSYFTNYYLLTLAQGSSPVVEVLALKEHLWRWMLALEILPAVLWFIGLFFIVQSPRWLLMKGRKEQADNVAAMLFTPEQAAKQVSHIEKALGKTQQPLMLRVKLLFSKRMHAVLAIGVLLAVAQQITGINVIFFYAPTIFEQSGVGTNAAFAQAVWIGVVNVIFTLVALFTIDKYGRKPLLICGLIGIVLAMGLCAWGFSQAVYELTPSGFMQLQQSFGAQTVAPLGDLVGQIYHSDVSFKSALMANVSTEHFSLVQSKAIALSSNINAPLILAGITLFVAAFALSLGPVMWVMFSEIFPNAIRAVAVSFVCVINNAVSFLVQLVFPWELAELGAATTFALYAIFALVSLVLVWRYAPETKSKSLEQIAVELGTH